MVQTLYIQVQNLGALVQTMGHFLINNKNYWQQQIVSIPLKKCALKAANIPLGSYDCVKGMEVQTLDVQVQALYVQVQTLGAKVQTLGEPLPITI